MYACNGLNVCMYQSSPLGLNIIGLSKLKTTQTRLELYLINKIKLTSSI